MNMLELSNVLSSMSIVTKKETFVDYIRSLKPINKTKYFFIVYDESIFTSPINIDEFGICVFRRLYHDDHSLYIDRTGEILRNKNNEIIFNTDVDDIIKNQKFNCFYFDSLTNEMVLYCTIK